jgi:CheY-like chemotaxis protein
MGERWRRRNLLSYSSCCALLKHWRGAGAVATGSPQASDFSNVQERSNAHFARIHNTRCMILDMRMPGMKWLELRRRAAASHREVPVIFIKAHGDEGDTHR